MILATPEGKIPIRREIHDRDNPRVITVDV
jgi:hypothetical protein